ncbi:hypothetical protein [Thorsellia anophelis]|uniref:Uncharacterized protein n=1 Tax=Thorsellia anophelis DSM 18579 TaxID=1123402 RepID=A0A1H9Z7C3_9GAMM|nr:hypothetical protein [Thorsellia anophelis]SES77353.1 hypothetical protein SAMN02583745_00452 [Thorsellia anophelis DSM 18579]
MIINIAMKQLGKKHPIKQEQITLPSLTAPITLKSLIEALVVQQIDEYVKKPVHQFESADNLSLSPIAPTSLISMMSAGKYHFDVNYNNNVVETDKAIACALEAYLDGLFVVFVDDQKIESLETQLQIEESSVITFIRLTFLVGRLW